MQLQTNPDGCSFCRKHPAVLHSAGGAYQLCTECCYLFYPQIDVRQAEADGAAIEDVCRSRPLAQPCCKCGIRSPQVFSEDGDYCLICAKRHKLPKADKIASRMGLSPEALDAFVQAVLSEEAALVPDPAEDLPDGTRMKCIGSFSVGTQIVQIIADTLTGVQYLTNEQCSGFSPLLDRDGRPLLYQEPQDSKQ
ncbi:MAG: hypothetical protein J5753_06875 [Oscillospiraceae bacterium]|nr:hypothetical protein [Oscillospiraceae bacterium]